MPFDTWKRRAISATGLDRDSVANVSLLVAFDKALLTDRAGRVPELQLDLAGGDSVVLGR
jgi:hypothetical protein